MVYTCISQSYRKNGKDKESPLAKLAKSAKKTYNKKRTKKLALLIQKELILLLLFAYFARDKTRLLFLLFWIL
jgi:pheromone shutdown protein TraB